MGCCASRPGSEDDGGAYPPISGSRTQGPNSSSRHITEDSPQQPASLASPRGSHASQSHAGPSHSHRHTNDRPNAPLRPIDPSHRCALPNSDPRSRQVPLVNSASSRWTSARLERERAAFWETQVTGNASTWRNLRAVIECLQKGDLPDAQAMLEAAGCTCPTGQPWDAVFGSRGERYKIPEWVVVEPRGLVEDDNIEEPKPYSTGGTQDHKQEGVDESSENIANVRCRLSSTQQDVVVRIRKDETVSSLIAKVHQQAQLSTSTTIRIFYRGRECKPTQPLEAHPLWKFENQHVLNAMIFE